MLDTVKNPRVNGLDLPPSAKSSKRSSRMPARRASASTSPPAGPARPAAKRPSTAITMAGERIARSHKIVADEPCELLGTNSAPNPQELLMSAVNACMTVGYVAGAAIRGIALDILEIDTKGQARPARLPRPQREVPPGYEAIDYEVRIKGDGTPEHFEAIHQTVMKTSPNYFNMSRPIRMNPKLSVG